jgi:hypothetical protein
MRKSKVIGISFPDQVLEKMEILRGDIPRSRYIWKILEKEFGLELKSSIEPRLELKSRIEHRLRANPKGKQTGDLK